MITVRYSEIEQDSQIDAKERERILLDRSIDLLSRAIEEGPKSMVAIEAVHFTTRLWTFLLEDLADPANGLSEELRASLISIGIWIVRECEAIRQEASTNLTGVRDIVKIIRESYE